MLLYHTEVMGLRILYIYRSKPDETTKKIASKFAGGAEVIEVKLYEDVDYEDLAKKILECDKIICWW